MKKMKTQNGFTLIELLVVIAIIGLLATIALASLNSARNKSADAAVKSNMANIGAQGELYYDSTGVGSYGDITSCTTGVFSDPNIAAMIVQAQASTVGGAATGSVVCSADVTANSQKWAITIGVLKSAGGYWCVDNTGNKKAESAPDGSNFGVCL